MSVGHARILTSLERDRFPESPFVVANLPEKARIPTRGLLPAVPSTG
jgi:hypothetical protein